jgi:SAM-dependent methyltransferase
LQRLVPNWRNLSVHESSPGWDIVSRRLANESRAYTASYLDPQVQRGAIVESVRTPSARYSCQDLERQTFDDASFDLVVTQDVFEHIFRPDLAIAEIARTLRPGGATIMTVPLVRGVHRSRRRARKAGETVELLIEPAEFHGNPIDGKGSLVTIDWGYDIVDYLMRHSGLSFLLLRAEDPHRGIVGDLLEVLIGFKRPSADL